ncbi:MAG TPA: two-component regulator propeller domain-containing protein [Puia sp.]|jgi:signal transduction histidine kinase/ligand-binding sensor domain-containing protein|nr:two-component regulator propeller domain-containing protein [Puia sp.]
MNTRRTIFGCLLTTQLLPTLLIAQQIPHFIEKLTTSAGLSSNTITDITQDDQGFLWIATTDGLNRFDGTEITQFYHQDDSHSLPHNFIYCIKRLPGNYLAIGTEGGLGFYDGHTGLFQNFYYRSDSAMAPFNNSILNMETDADGNLWAISKNCIFVFDPLRRLKKLIPSGFTHTLATRNRINFVEKIWPLTDGDMLLYLHDGWRIYSKKTGLLTDSASSPRLKQLTFLHLLDSTPSHPAGYISSRLFKVFDKFFLLLHRDSLFLFDETGRRRNACHFPYDRYPYVSWSQRIAPIDSTRILLLFHNYGLAILSIDWRNKTPVLDSLSTPLLCDQKYNTVLCDRQNNWWLATSRVGLQKIVPSRQCFTGVTLLDNSSHRTIKYEANSFSRYGRTLWVATYGDGFFAIDPSTHHQQQHRLLNTGIPTWTDFIWNVRQIDKDTLWVGTQVGMFWYCLTTRTNGRLPPFPGKPPALDEVSVTTQFRDSHGLVWMGLGKGNGLCCFDSARHRFDYYPGNSEKGYPLRYPLSIAEDTKGDLWMTGDASNSLVKWHRDSGLFTVIPLPSAVRIHIGPLNGIVIDHDSVFWLSSLTRGLVRFVPSTGSLSVYGHENGLANSYTGSLFKDSTGRIWMMTEGGLACFNPRTESFLNYTEDNGLPVTCLTAEFFYDPLTGRLYNGGHGGFFYFLPGGIDPYGRPPRPMITSISVNGNQRIPDPDSTAEFHSQENDISIRYAAVDLTDGHTTRYAWRLLGADTAWVMADRQRQINFSRLAPGKYTFLVRAATGNGVWNPVPAAFSFRIYPPFTQTPGFYTLLFLAIASLAWLLYRYRRRQTQRSRQIRSEISRNLHDEVGANLTNISLSSLLARRQLHNDEAVSQLLERIYQDSQQVSESMRDIVWSIDPNIETLGEALPRMLHYASGLLEAKDIGLEAAVAPEVEQLKLNMHQRRDIYLIFKEAVNNMARHSKASSARIRFDLDGHALQMTVQDNGSGFDTLAHAGHNGLRNMQERASRHQWKLNIRSSPLHGTTITLKT